MTPLLVHLSDLHLGFRAFAREDQGSNLRERDVASAFRWALQETIRLRPAVVLITGDIFDHPDPPHTAILAFHRGVNLLRSHLPGTPVLLIAGERDTPASPAEPGPVAILDALPGVEAAATIPRSLRFRESRMRALLVPHRAGIQPPWPEIRPDPKARWNLLLIRGSAVGGGEGIPISGRDWSYVAVGGPHRPMSWAPNVRAAGALERPERTPWGSAGEERGFLSFDLEREVGEFHPVPGRAIVDLAPVRITAGDTLAGSRRLHEVVEGLPGGIDGKVVRVRLSGDILTAAEGVSEGMTGAIAERSAHVEYLLGGGVPVPPTTLDPRSALWEPERLITPEGGSQSGEVPLPRKGVVLLTSAAADLRMRLAAEVRRGGAIGGWGEAHGAGDAIAGPAAAGSMGDAIAGPTAVGSSGDAIAGPAVAGSRGIAIAASATGGVARSAVSLAGRTPFRLLPPFPEGPVDPLATLLTLGEVDPAELLRRGLEPRTPGGGKGPGRAETPWPAITESQVTAPAEDPAGGSVPGSMAIASAESESLGPAKGMPTPKAIEFSGPAMGIATPKAIEAAGSTGESAARSVAELRADWIEASGDFEAGTLEWVRDRQNAESHLQEYRDRARELRTRIRTLEREGESALCPTCGKPIGDGLPALLETLRDEWEGVVQDGKWWKRRREQLDPKPLELRKLEERVFRLHSEMEALGERHETERVRDRLTRPDGASAALPAFAAFPVSPVTPGEPQAEAPALPSLEDLPGIRPVLREARNFLHRWTEGRINGLVAVGSELLLVGQGGERRAPEGTDLAALRLALRLALLKRLADDPRAPRIPLLVWELHDAGCAELATAFLEDLSKEAGGDRLVLAVVPPAVAGRIPELCDYTLDFRSDERGRVRSRRIAGGIPRLQIEGLATTPPGRATR